MKALRFIALMGVAFLATEALAGENQPVPQPLRTCQTKENCPPDHFCEGRGPRKTCKACIDCPGVYKRKPRRSSYDGESCAFDQTFCGECLDGFDEIGAICYPKPTSASPSTRFGKEQIANGEKDLETASFQNWIFFVVGGIVLVACFACGCCTYEKYTKRGRGRGSLFEEEENLTEARPTAPLPDEYNQQPASIYTNSAYPTNSLTRCVSEKKVNAIPFQPGNGSSRWDMVPNGASDAVDGGSASTPTQEQGAAETNNGTNGNANGESGNTIHHNGASAQPQLPNSTVVQGQMAPWTYNSTSRPSYSMTRALNGGVGGSRSFGVPPSPQQGSGHTYQDSVVMTVGVGAFATIRFPAPSLNTNPNPSASSPTPLRTVSAPQSPRRIDDSYVNLNELEGQESFHRGSDESMDSGNGSNEDSHLVPNGSDEYLSEMNNDSGLDEAAFPVPSVRAAELAVVPSFTSGNPPRPAQANRNQIREYGNFESMEWDHEE